VFGGSTTWQVWERRTQTRDEGGVDSEVGRKAKTSVLEVELKKLKWRDDKL